MSTANFEPTILSPHLPPLAAPVPPAPIEQPAPLAESKKYIMNPAVAAHFTPDELHAAVVAWYRKHEASIPKGDGPCVFPDPYVQKASAAMQRANKVHRAALDEPGDVYDSGSAEIKARIEAAAFAGGKPRRRDRSPERFMTGIHDLVEPYFAVRNGMSLGMAAKVYKIANIKDYIAKVQTWLSVLKDRDALRLETAVEKRRKDAAQARIAEPPRAVPVVVVDAIPDRGWDGINVKIPIAVRAASPKKWDQPWVGEVPLARKQPTAVNKCSSDADQRSTPPRHLPIAPEVQTVTPDQVRLRELDNGLIALLDVMPYWLPDGSVNGDRADLVDIVNMAQEGKTNSEIADDLGVSLSTVRRRMAEIRAKSPCQHINY